jgi:RNA polymerase sigma factor (sigma-70 family)
MKSSKEVELACKIFDEYGALIYAVIHLQVNNKSDIDDIYQNLFLSLIHKPIPSHIQNTMGYIYKAITNDVIDCTRRRRAYKDAISRYAKCVRCDTVQKDPEKVAIQTEETQRIFRLIETRLPRHEAQAITKQYGQGRDPSDAARRMHVSRRTLSRYICTGLKKLRQFINESEGNMEFHS